MEDHIVKFTQMTSARSGMVAVLSAAAVALTACSAGQISQTSDQVAAVNGVFAEQKNAVLRDVAVVLAPDNTVALKFTLANAETKGSDLVLRSAKIDGKTVAGTENFTVPAGCNLIADSKAAIDAQADGSRNLCHEYTATSVTGVNKTLIGGRKTVRFSLSNSSSPLEVVAPVVGYTPEAGALHRGRDASVITEKEFQKQTENPESAHDNHHHK